LLICDLMMALVGMRGKLRKGDGTLWKNMGVRSVSWVRERREEQMLSLKESSGVSKRRRACHLIFCSAIGWKPLWLQLCIDSNIQKFKGGGGESFLYLKDLRGLFIGCSAVKL